MTMSSLLRGAVSDNVQALPNPSLGAASCLCTRRDRLGRCRGGAPPGDPQPATLSVKRSPHFLGPHPRVAPADSEVPRA